MRTGWQVYSHQVTMSYSFLLSMLGLHSVVGWLLKRECSRFSYLIQSKHQIAGISQLMPSQMCQGVQLNSTNWATSRTNGTSQHS